MSTLMPSSLDGVKVLICRPEPAASALGKQLIAAGAQCRQLPTISINPLPIENNLKQIGLQLDEFSHIIVISKHAAEIGLDFLEQYWPQWPIKQHWYGIGEATNKQLSAFGIAPEQPVSAASHFDSETLLAHPRLQNVNAQKVLILKGKGGRDVLRESLTGRGAQVVEAELYERSLPSYSIETIRQHLLAFAPAYIVALSAETVENLLKLASWIPDQASETNAILQQAIWILPSMRVAEFAQTQQLRHYLLPAALTGEAIIEEILTSQRINQT